ncbi:hypothetical protein [Georgenia deserti]|uniref:Uncharacterized protein n=1 Tax=Georgenia deserti TaxID=2093781 RepID=A0ABW4L4W1_9MICO
MTTFRPPARPAQRRRRLRGPAASLAAVLALAACGGSGQSSARGGGTDDGDGGGGEVTAADQVRAYESLVRQGAPSYRARRARAPTPLGTRPAWRA